MAFEPIPLRIVLGINKFDLSQKIVIKRGCIDTVNIFASFINKDNSTFVLPADTTAKIRLLKPDKEPVFNNSYEIVGNSVHFKVTEQMQAAPGTGYLEIVLMNSGQTLTTSTCDFVVLPNVHDDSGIPSTPEYLAIINSLAQVDAAIISANNAATNANSIAQQLTNESLIIFKPDVPTYADIATTYPTPAIGWTTKATDTGIKWRYNGTTWVNIGTEATDKVGDLTQSTITNKTNVVAITNELNANKLDKTGDSKDNTVTFTEASADTDIASGDSHATLFGKILKRFHSIATSLSNKFDKTNIVSQDTINDATKVPSSQVTYALGQEIDSLKQATSGTGTVNTAYANAIGGGVTYRIVNGICYLHIEITLNAISNNYAVINSLPNAAQVQHVSTPAWDTSTNFISAYIAGTVIYMSGGAAGATYAFTLTYPVV